MKKPTIPEIQERIDEMGYDFDAEMFFAFYASKGWMIGKSPMKDWKMAMVTWQGGRPKRVKPVDSRVAQWEKQCGSWVRTACVLTMNAHQRFIAMLKDPDFRAWAESENELVKEI